MVCIGLGQCKNSGELTVYIYSSIFVNPDGRQDGKIYKKNKSVVYLTSGMDTMTTKLLPKSISHTFCTPKGFCGVCTTLGVILADMLT